MKIMLFGRKVTTRETWKQIVSAISSRALLDAGGKKLPSGLRFSASNLP
jgi:hypothetical protein